MNTAPGAPSARGRGFYKSGLLPLIEVVVEGELARLVIGVRDFAAATVLVPAQVADAVLVVVVHGHDRAEFVSDHDHGDAIRAVRVGDRVDRKRLLVSAG